MCNNNKKYGSSCCWNLLLDELWADDSEEGGAGLIGHGLRQQGLPRPRGAVQDNALQLD